MSAIKKQQLYSSLWETCDNLRGGMEPSEYKNYILILLFIKYISDKYKGKKYGVIKVPNGASFDDFIALKGKKNIGEQINKKIEAIAKENDLINVITTVSFNDDQKLGTAETKVELLSNIIEIFERPEFDFKSNVALGDDILGDAYEYLMKKFASASGKSKGEFYTPAEVSRILASVLEIDKIKKNDMTCYDPACGSGSLLMKAASCAPIEYPIQIYGQENEPTTAGISKMNMVIHNFSTAKLEIGDTFSAPNHIDEKTGLLKKFDFIVVNPPFSYKKWMINLTHTERFEGYGAMPPRKVGDYAWLMHVLYSLKPNGKAAVILPPGVLSRGNAESIIRKNIIAEDKGCLLKGIIAFPTNIFMGTGIQAIALIIDKEDAKTRDSIFMIDAKDGYIQDGNKNRLREKDIERIVTTFNNKIEIEHYSRNVSLKEIIEENDCNLNIARYIKPVDKDIVHDVDCHINGSIPKYDIEIKKEYFDVFIKLKNKLFKNGERKNTYELKCDYDSIRDTIKNDEDVKQFISLVKSKADKFSLYAKKQLEELNKSSNLKDVIIDLKQKIISEYKDIILIDKLDPYESYMKYMNEIMSDDLNVVIIDGFEAGREIETDANDKRKTPAWDGKVIPKMLVQKKYFAEELKLINDINIKIDSINDEIIKLFSEADADSLLYEFINSKSDNDKDDEKKDKKDKQELSIEEKAVKVKMADVSNYINALLNNYTDDVVKKLVEFLEITKKKEKTDFLDKNQDIKALVGDDYKKGNIIKLITSEKCKLAKDDLEDEMDKMLQLQDLVESKKQLNTELNAKQKLLDAETKNKYSKLSIDEIKILLIDDKWLFDISSDIERNANEYIQNFATDIIDLYDRYKVSLNELNDSLKKYEKETNKYLEEMGYEF